MEELVRVLSIGVTVGIQSLSLDSLAVLQWWNSLTLKCQYLKYPGQYILCNCLNFYIVNVTLKHVRVFPNSLGARKVPISKTICSSPTGGTRELSLKCGEPLNAGLTPDSSSSEYLSHKPGDFYLSQWLFHTWHLLLQSWKHPEAPLWDRGPTAPAVFYLLRLRVPWEEEPRPPWAPLTVQKVSTTNSPCCSYKGPTQLRSSFTALFGEMVRGERLIGKDFWGEGVWRKNRNPKWTVGTSCAEVRRWQQAWKWQPFVTTVACIYTYKISRASK